MALLTGNNRLKMKILITGSNGLLGQKIVRQLKKRQTNFLATSLGENRNSLCPESNYVSLDITNKDEIEKIFNSYNPTIVINTAAMTNVDACEENADRCVEINVNAVNYLNNTCEKHNAHLIQLSTDFVFDGENGPYSEQDSRNPLSVYAKSKRDAEDCLINGVYNQWSILRTIIVFGKGENLSRSNIVLWAKSALMEKKELTIVNDQFRAPTWADDLAWACIQTGKLKSYGIYHISGPETFSIYELVTRIGKHFGYELNQVKPISSVTLNQKAKRPPRTGFIIDKARKELGYDPQSFEESLDKLFN